jgi:hypothetical protein
LTTTSIAQLFLKRPAAILLFIALALVVVARGIVPALSKIDTDFPNYFTAAKIVADGGNADRLYDNSWFQEQMRRYQIGKPSAGEFSPFPPPTALLLVPLARLNPLDALRVLTCVNVLCLICAIKILAKILSWNFVDCGAFVLLSGFAVLNSFRFGQPYILVSLSCILGYYARLKGRPLLAGICFGLFTPIKYFPIVILAYFACRKEWKLVLGGAGAILIVGAASIGVLGWKVHEEFLSSVLGNHLVARLDMQDPFTASYQSFDSLFRRLFIFDAALNPRPLCDLPRLASIAIAVTKASILLASIATLVKLARTDAADTDALSIGILGVGTLLAAPATATYHFDLLWLPVGLLVSSFFRGHAVRSAYFILGAYALIGFFPYGHAYRFEGQGGLTVLAYPRLFLLLAVLICCIYSVWTRESPSVPGREIPT